MIACNNIYLSNSHLFIVVNSIFLRSLPQATVDVPVTSNAAYNIVSFSGHENDPNVSQNIAYHTTQRQDMDTCDYDNIEPEGVAAPGSFTETPLYEPV